MLSDVSGKSDPTSRMQALSVQDRKKAIAIGILLIVAPVVMLGSMQMTFRDGIVGMFQEKPKDPAGYEVWFSIAGSPIYKIRDASTGDMTWDHLKTATLVCIFMLVVLLCGVVGVILIAGALSSSPNRFTRWVVSILHQTW